MGQRVAGYNDAAPELGSSSSGAAMPSVGTAGNNPSTWTGITVLVALVVLYLIRRSFRDYV